MRFICVRYRSVLLHRSTCQDSNSTLVDNKVISQISKGLMVLVGIGSGRDASSAIHAHQDPTDEMRSE